MYLTLFLRPASSSSSIGTGHGTTLKKARLKTKRNETVLWSWFKWIQTPPKSITGHQPWIISQQLAHNHDSVLTIYPLPVSFIRGNVHNRVGDSHGLGEARTQAVKEHRDFVRMPKRATKRNARVWGPMHKQRRWIWSRETNLWSTMG